MSEGGSRSEVPVKALARQTHASPAPPWSDAPWPSGSHELCGFGFGFGFGVGVTFQHYVHGLIATAEFGAGQEDNGEGTAHGAASAAWGLEM